MKKTSKMFSSLIVYFLILVLFVGIRIFSLFVKIPVSSEIYDLIFTIVVQVGLMFLLPVFLFSALQKQKVKKTLLNFGYEKIGFMPILVSILIGVLCYFLNLSIASFFSSIIHLVGYEQAPGLVSSSNSTLLAFLINVIAVAILPAICEETSHRGLLLNGLSSLGYKNAIIISSLFFGLMHLNINQFFYATILGFIIAITRVVSRNIVPAIIVHFMNNFLSLYFSFAKANNLFGSQIYDFFTEFVFSGNLFSFFLKNFIVLISLIFGIVVLITILLKQTRIKRVNKMLVDIAEINREFDPYNPYLQNNSNLMNLHFLNSLMQQYNIKNLNSMVFTESESKKTKPTAFEITAMCACFTIGILITIFTFVWGVI